MMEERRNREGLDFGRERDYIERGVGESRKGSKIVNYLLSGEL